MEVPEDVLPEILVRLPVRSLLKFRCVCKAWRALIDSPDFGNMHLSHPSKNNSENYALIIRRVCRGKDEAVVSIHESPSLGRVVVPDLDLPINGDIGIVGTCNGIFCIMDDYLDIYLLNPATRAFRTLPARPFGCPEEMYCRPDAVGFGFDFLKNEYKVVTIMCFYSTGWDEGSNLAQAARAEIYNLSSNSWRQIDSILADHDYTFTSGYLLINGSCHWCIATWSSFEILCFDMSTEVFRTLQIPDSCLGSSFSHGDKRVNLVVLDDSLALVILPCPSYDLEDLDQGSEQFIDIWVMMEYGVEESWMKKLSIGPFSGVDFIITSLNNDELLLQNKDYQMVSCFLRKHNHDQLIKKHNIFGFIGCNLAAVYKESMVSLLGGSTDDRAAN